METRIPHNEALKKLVDYHLKFACIDQMEAVGELASFDAKTEFLKQTTSNFDSIERERGHNRRAKSLEEKKDKANFCRDVKTYIDLLWDGHERNHDNNVYLIQIVDDRISQINGNVTSFNSSLSTAKFNDEQRRKDPEDMGFGCGSTEIGRLEECLKKEQTEQSYWLDLRWIMIRKMV